MSQSTFCAKIHSAFLKHTEGICFDSYPTEAWETKEFAIVENYAPSQYRSAGTLSVAKLRNGVSGSVEIKAYVPFRLQMQATSNSVLSAGAEDCLAGAGIHDDVRAAIFTDGEGVSALMIECRGSINSEVSDSCVEQFVEDFIKKIQLLVAMRQGSRILLSVAQKKYELLQSDPLMRVYAMRMLIQEEMPTHLHKCTDVSLTHGSLRNCPTMRGCPDYNIRLESNAAHQTAKNGDIPFDLRMEFVKPRTLKQFVGYTPRWPVWDEISPCEARRFDNQEAEQLLADNSSNVPSETQRWR
jgi:hypothetical protein